MILPEVARATRGEDIVPDVIELVPDLKAEELDLLLRKADRRTEVGHRELAFYLAEMHDRGLHQMLGFSSTLEYACRRLEMSRRHVQELIVVGRALNELQLVDEAFCAGKIRWSRVRLLVRIAVPETERAWLERALTLGWNAFDREVATSERGRPPREDRKGLPKVRIVVRGRLERVAYETWEVAKQKLEDERGERMTDADCIAYAGSLILGTKRGGAIESRDPIDDSIYRVVMQKCPDCETASIRTPEGLEEIDQVMAECISCDAPCENMEDDPDHESRTPPALRRKILIRDGLACRICRSRQQLMAHHIIFASRGGPTTASNLCCLCSRCHGLVHENLLIVRGKAPNGLSITDRHGVPLDAKGPLVGPAIARIRMEAPSSSRVLLGTSPAADVGEVLPPAANVVTFRSICAKVSHLWWKLHQRLFTFIEAIGEFRFQAGEPMNEEAQPESLPGVDAEGDDRANRPKRLSDVIGQKAAVHTLSVAVKAARKRNTSADHALLLGAAGLGKTSLAQALANEIGTRLRTVTGATIRDPGVLLRLLANLDEKDVLFIDEIHALPRRVMECLYEAMEDGRISVTANDGHASKAVQISLPRFTLVGATTEIGKLPEPFVSRFPIREYLMPYADAEISVIVSRAAARDGVPIDPDAGVELASVSRGSPRQAIGLFRRVRDEALVVDQDRIDRAAVLRTLEGGGIGRDGLSTIERMALDVLRLHGAPMGVSRWAAASGLPAATLRQICEPELLRQGLITVTPRGRMARAQLRAVARDGVRYEDLPEISVTGFLCRDGRAWALS